MLGIGTIVDFVGRYNPCVVIANRAEPHIYKYGVREYDDLKLGRSVPQGYDYTIVEINVDFSPYIDVLEHEVRVRGM